MEDLLLAYEDNSLPSKNVQVEYLHEEGDDFGGLTKDLCSSAWKLILPAFFRAENAMVPFLPLHHVRDKRHWFKNIGRILTHCAALLKFIPARFSRTTLLQLIYGPDFEIDEERLLQNLKLILLYQQINFYFWLEI